MLDGLEGLRDGELHGRFSVDARLQFTEQGLME